MTTRFSSLQFPSVNIPTAQVPYSFAGEVDSSAGQIYYSASPPLARLIYDVLYQVENTYYPCYLFNNLLSQALEAAKRGVFLEYKRAFQFLTGDAPQEQDFDTDEEPDTQFINTNGIVVPFDLKRQAQMSTSYHMMVMDGSGGYDQSLKLWVANAYKTMLHTTSAYVIGKLRGLPSTVINAKNAAGDNDSLRSIILKAMSILSQQGVIDINNFAGSNIWAIMPPELLEKELSGAEQMSFMTTGSPATDFFNLATVPMIAGARPFKVLNMPTWQSGALTSLEAALDVDHSKGQSAIAIKGAGTGTINPFTPVVLKDGLVRTINFVTINTVPITVSNGRALIDVFPMLPKSMPANTEVLFPASTGAAYKEVYIVTQDAAAYCPMVLPPVWQSNQGVSGINMSGNLGVTNFAYVPLVPNVAALSVIDESIIGTSGVMPLWTTYYDPKKLANMVRYIYGCGCAVRPEYGVRVLWEIA